MSFNTRNQGCFPNSGNLRYSILYFSNFNSELNFLILSRFIRMNFSLRNNYFNSKKLLFPFLGWILELILKGIKKSIDKLNTGSISGWGGWTRTSGMTESKSVALPLGYTPEWWRKVDLNPVFRI